MMKSKLWILAVLLVSALLVTSCAPTEPAAEAEVEEVAEAEAPEEVTLRIFTRWSDASPVSQAFRDRVAEFQELNPHITIEDESINDEAGFDNKWATYIATDDLPAIFQNYGGANTYDYIAEGLFLDLDESFAANPDWKNGFLDFFSQWQYEDVAGTYAVPYEFFAIALFYNKDIFDEVGVQVPTTIEEFEAASEALLAAGYVPLAFGEKDNFKGDHLWVTLSLKTLGGAAMNDLATGDLQWTGPEMTEVFGVMADWNSKGYLGENVVGVDYATETAMFLAGEAAMKFDGSWVLSEMDASPIADSIGVAPFPYFPETDEFAGVYMGGPGAGLSINGSLTGAEKEAAIQLLEFLSSVEHFSYLQETTGGGVFPAKMEAATTIGPVTAEYIAVLSDADAFSTGGTALLPEVSTQMRNSIQGLFAGLSVEEALQEIADKQAELTE